MPDAALGTCRNESLNADGQAPPTRFFNGMVAPFVNYSLAGFLWYQVSTPAEYACARGLVAQKRL